MKSWLSVVVLAIPAWGQAATLHVPADHGTIQAGLIAAAPGDTVLVAPGSYTEYILMPVGVALIAADGPDSTRIVTAGLAEKILDERVMEIAEGAERSTLVEGFTFDPGDIHGTAIFCERASPTIRGNVLADGFGFGFNIRRGSPLIENNRIVNTRTFGMVIFASSPDVVGNTIAGCKPRAIDISGVKSKPVIGGGDRSRANHFYGNTTDIVNGSVNDINATGNDWGWATTATMEANPWPGDVANIIDGNDKGKSHRGRGVVDYRNWIKAESDGGGASSGNRWLLPLLILAGLALVIVVVVRR